MYLLVNWLILGLRPMPYKPANNQLVFPKASKDELARAIHARMPDYFEYEIKDFLDAFGESVQDLLLAGKQVNIPKLGTFTITTNGQKEYFNVVEKQRKISYGSYTIKFKITKMIRDRISNSIKKLMIATLKLRPDSVVQEQSNVKE